MNLDLRYDGPIPPADPAACRVPARQRAALFQRLAGETRAQAARLRLKHQPGPHLDRLAERLARYREGGVCWFQRGSAATWES